MHAIILTTAALRVHPPPCSCVASHPVMTVPGGGPPGCPVTPRPTASSVFLITLSVCLDTPRPPSAPFHRYLLSWLPKFHFLRTPHYPLSAILILSPISHCRPPPNLLLFAALSSYLIDPSGASHGVSIGCPDAERRADAGDERTSSRVHTCALF